MNKINKSILAIAISSSFLTACSNEVTEEQKLTAQIQQLQQQNEVLMERYLANGGVPPTPQQLSAPPQPIVQPQPPVVIQQPQQQDNTLSNMLLGGMLGHAIGSSGNSRSYSPPSVVHHYNERVIEKVPASPSVISKPVGSSARLPTPAKPVVAPAVPTKPAVAPTKPSFSIRQSTPSSIRSYSAPSRSFSIRGR